MKNSTYFLVFPVAKVKSESHCRKIFAHRYDGFYNVGTR